MHGTRVNGRVVAKGARHAVARGSRICIGQTMLWIESLVAGTEPKPAPAAPPSQFFSSTPTTPLSASQAFAANVELDDVTIAETMMADIAEPVDCVLPLGAVERRLALLCELPFEFGGQSPLDRVLQQTLERLVEAIPSAQRGAILVEDPTTGQLLLMAHLPTGAPSVSMTVANQAFCQREAISWRRTLNMTESQSESQIAAGIYAPLVIDNKALGIVCMDSSDNAAVFSSNDLKYLMAAARHIATAISHRLLQDSLRRDAALVERLLTNFSPAVRRRLVERARHGRLRLGGEKSEVTIVSSDIRGFTTAAAAMDAGDVVEMLNSYFSALVNAIFQHAGTVDKFIGDAILAVFGSPEPDPDHHAQAVRAAWAMQAAIQQVNEKRRACGQVVCEMGIGIHCGEVLHGFIGSEERMEFTVIGDTVNRTARLCAGAGPSQIVISPELHQRVWKLVTASKTEIQTKHEGTWPAYLLQSCRGGPIAAPPVVPPA